MLREEARWASLPPSPVFVAGTEEPLLLAVDSRAGAPAAVVWPCALYLLAAMRAAPPGSPLHPRGPGVVDLGSGTGVVGIALAAWASYRRAVLTDQPRHLALLRRSVQLSRGAIPAGVEVSVQALQWAVRPTDGDSAAELRLFAQCGTAVACECIYDPCHMGRSPLVAVVRRFLAAPCPAATPPRRVIVAFETRDADIEGDVVDQLREVAEVTTVSRTAAPHPSEGNTMEGLVEYVILSVVSRY